MLTLGAPGILTGFAIGDVSGKGGTNLSAGAVLITGPLDFFTAPVQFPFLIPAMLRSGQERADSRFVEKASNNQDDIKSLLDDSRTRDLIKREKVALAHGYTLIPAERFEEAFVALKRDGSALAWLMHRDEIEERHLRFLYVQEAGLYEQGLKKDWSRVYRELSEHPNSPIDVIEKLARYNKDNVTRKKALQRLEKIKLSEQGIVPNP